MAEIEWGMAALHTFARAVALPCGQTAFSIPPYLMKTILLSINYGLMILMPIIVALFIRCLLYTSDAADERSSVDLGGRRIIKKKNK